MNDTVYRIGECVYFKAASSIHPYRIRRIEGFIKQPNGQIIVKTVVFLRRRDIPSGLASAVDCEKHIQETYGRNYDFKSLSAEQKYVVKLRELFLTDETEELPLRLIKGKCSVNVLIETESLLSYVNDDDTFFYSVSLDSENRSFKSEGNEICVGSEYQASIPALQNKLTSPRTEDCETLLWTPHHGLSDAEIHDFTVKTVNIGTMTRLSSEPGSVLSCASAASRDATLFHAMDILHQNNYFIQHSLLSLKDSQCVDEFEKWSSQEGQLFEAGLKRFGKDFPRIRNSYLPWKSTKDLIEFYYAWKTTDRYVIFKLKKPCKLKSVRVKYEITNFDDLSKDINRAGKCESCRELCYKRGIVVRDSSKSKNITLCLKCWEQWMKYGGF